MHNETRVLGASVSSVFMPCHLSSIITWRTRLAVLNEQAHSQAKKENIFRGKYDNIDTDVINAAAHDDDDPEEEKKLKNEEEDEDEDKEETWKSKQQKSRWPMTRRPALSPFSTSKSIADYQLGVYSWKKGPDSF